MRSSSRSGIPPAEADARTAQGVCYTLDITERCNCDCVFCFAPPRHLQGRGKRTPLDTVEEQVRSVKEQGYEMICFTGGEPTTHPDLPKMVAYARKLGLRALVNTNGLRFATKSYLDSFAPSEFACTLSFHSHKPEVYDHIMGAKAFRKAVAGIRNLLAARVPITFSHVAMRQNYKDLPDWVDYVNDNFRPPGGWDTLLVSASIFFNQEVHEPDGSMVRFSLARPYIMKAVERARFHLYYRTSCTASECLFEDGFHDDASRFPERTRERNLERLKTLPLPRQKEMLSYFVPERCYSCELFLDPSCKGIRKKYLLVIGYGEFESLLSAEEKEYIDGLRALPGSEHEERRVRSSPYIALGTTGSAPGSSVRELASALSEDRDQNIRREAARALSELGEAALEALGVLLEALKDDDAQTRRNAALALAKARPDPEKALPAMLRALRDPDPQTRRNIAMGVCAMSPPPSEAAPALARALRDPDFQVRRDTAIALSKMQPVPGAAAGALSRALGDEDDQTRRNSALALSRLEPLPKSAIKPLCRALKDPDQQVRREAAYALTKLKPSPRGVGRAMLEALRDTDAQVRREASLTLSRMTPPLKGAAPALAKALKDGNPQVRGNAALALGRMERLDRDSTKALAEAARDPDPQVRNEAVNALSRLRDRC